QSRPRRSPTRFPYTTLFRSVANEAYHLSLHGAPAPVLDGLSGEQRFFLSWAQVWREKQRDEDLRSQVTSNPHSPAKYRVNGVVRSEEHTSELQSLRQRVCRL